MTIIIPKFSNKIDNIVCPLCMKNIINFSKEHVIAKCAFTKPIPHDNDLLVVNTCRECNNPLGSVEFNFFSLARMHNQSPETDISRHGIDVITNSNDRVKKQFYRIIKDGINEFSIDSHEMIPVFRKILRCLALSYTGTVLDFNNSLLYRYEYNNVWGEEKSKMETIILGTYGEIIVSCGFLNGVFTCLLELNNTMYFLITS